MKKENILISNKSIKSLKIIVIFAVLFFTQIILQNVSASSYSIDEYTINATIKENGMMHVEEYLKYTFLEDMNGLFRDIMYKYTFKNQKNNMEATSSRYQASDIKNIQVHTSNTSFNNLKNSTLENESNLKNGMDGYYSLEERVKGSYRKYLKVYSPVKENASKYVKYEYDIIDAIVKYEDRSEIYWNFLGKDWEEDINNLNINISFENKNVLEDVLIYPHTYGKISDANISNNIINIHSNRISSGVAVDARVIFPNEFVPEYSTIINEKYDFEALKEIEEIMMKDKENHFVSIKYFGIIAIIAIIFFIYMLIISINNSSKKYKKSKDIEIYTNPLENLELGEYATLLSRYIGYEDTNLIIATLLDLSNRKYIKMDARKKSKKDVFDIIDYEYHMELDETKSFDNLNKYEIILVNYIFNSKISENTDVENFKYKKLELNKRFKKLSNNYALNKKFHESNQKLNKEKTEKFFYKDSGNLYKILFVGIILLIAMLAYNIFFVSPLIASIKSTIVIVSSFVILFYIAILALTIESCSYIIKDEYMSEYEYLRGLKKYLKEYSLLKDRYPIEIALWDRYLVFATIFGIANKVSKEFKEELIKQGYDDDYIYMHYPLLNMSMHSMYMNSQVASSTGSSSSGGYSGGGSGGGGRRWWRRRCLLT